MRQLKKILLCILLVSFLMTGCEKQSDTALIISGAEVDKEIYSYFYDKIYGRPNDFGLPENPQKSDLDEAATRQCVRYVAANTSFASRGLKLTPAEKVSISEQVNNLWVRSEKHYNSIGVSKKTLTKIITSQTYESAIFSSVYDKGTSDVKGEAGIQKYFYDNYTAFRCVCAYFSSADGTELSQQKKNNLLDSMDQIASSVPGNSEQFTEICNEHGFAASNTIILKKGAEGYPEGFFDRVFSQNAGTATRFAYDECVFVVWKEDIKELGEGVYANYRADCIEEMYAEEWENQIESYLTQFTVEKA